MATATIASLVIAASSLGVPGNDECVDAWVANLGDNHLNTIDATTSDEAFDDALCSSSYLGSVWHDVWFQFTPDDSGSLAVSTCGLVDFDSSLVVYSGDCSSLEQIACNGDGAGCPGYSSVLDVPVVVGQEYRIRVGGYSSGDEGSGHLNLALNSVPTGACCADGLCIGEMTKADCSDALGDYQGDGTNCAGTDCGSAYGFCCVGYDCWDSLSEEECLDQGGFWGGSDSVCEWESCDTAGACCVGDDCVYDLSYECEIMNGNYVGGDCEAYTCSDPTGACCDGLYCTEVTEISCAAVSGGVYLGDGTTCTGDPCDPTYGACCVGDVLQLLGWWAPHT